MRQKVYIITTADHAESSFLGYPRKRGLKTNKLSCCAECIKTAVLFEIIQRE